MAKKRLSPGALIDIARSPALVQEAWNTLIDHGVDPVGLHRLIKRRAKAITGRPAKRAEMAALHVSVTRYQSENPGASVASAIRAAAAPSITREGLKKEEARRIVRKLEVGYLRFRRTLQK